MANEYQITQNSVEVLRDGSGAAQISQNSVEVLRDALGPLQFSLTAIEVIRSVELAALRRRTLVNQ